LGAVGFANLRWYNAMFIGLAPLLAIMGAMFLALSPHGWSLHLSDFKHWIFAAPILAMCLPSSTDLKLELKSWHFICLTTEFLSWRSFKF
jgi:hypothetical protein